jgi:hypothetical protein
MNPSVNQVSQPSPANSQPVSEKSTLSTPSENSKTTNGETHSSVTPVELSEVDPTVSSRQQPIPPPSHPMQYRAIGLIQGQYQPIDEQLTRGMLLLADGTEIDAVLLGRVISLVKNHLDLAQSHLWVVYPRTRQMNDQLHVQIVGVWEPETLAIKVPDVTDTSDEKTSIATNEDTNVTNDIQHGYFSIRGEVIFHSQEEEKVIIKIRQSSKPSSEKPKFFKLKLKGTLEDKPIGNFWDLQVKLEGNLLVIHQANNIGKLTSQKRPFTKTKRKPYYGKREEGNRYANDARPVSPQKKSLLPKPTISKPNPRPK